MFRKTNESFKFWKFYDLIFVRIIGIHLGVVVISKHSMKS